MVRSVDYAAMIERRCSKCQLVKPVSEFNKYSDPKQLINGWRYYSQCRPCMNEGCRTYGVNNKPRRNARLRHWRANNPELARVKDRRARLKAKYGLTEVEVEDLWAAYEGLCWLCRSRDAVAVDHDHATGKVRGMTCHGCNSVVLSRADADPAYLARVAAYQAAGEASTFLDQPCHADVLLRIANGGPA